uniref:Uncharacterized protein n=1 Tax=Anguilla anguilla TaxID=7936 RepID=A0A0E9XFP7_ANGAN
MTHYKQPLSISNKNMKTAIEIIPVILCSAPVCPS